MGFVSDKRLIWWRYVRRNSIRRNGWLLQRVGGRLSFTFSTMFIQLYPMHSQFCSLTLEAH